MKVLVFLLLSVLFCSFVTFGAESLQLSLPLIVAFAVGLIELAARLVPTVGMWAPTGVILKVLNWLSELLNNKKK